LPAYSSLICKKAFGVEPKVIQEPIKTKDYQMKNGLVVWNVLLTLLAGYLLFAHLNKKEGKVNSSSKGAGKDSASANASSCRIGYFEMDSIEAHFDMVKDVQAEIQTKEKEYTTELSKLDMTYQKKIQEYQEKGSTMTQDDYQRAQADLKQLEGILKGKKQELDQQYQDFITRRNLSLKKKIEEFIAEYNKEKDYAYIVVYEPGLFYYKDTAYNVTSDVIKGLNEAYKKKKD
jgi:outer membrane protein